MNIDIIEHYNKFLKFASEYGRHYPIWEKLDDRTQYFWINEACRYGWKYPSCYHCKANGEDCNEVFERAYECDCCLERICRNCSYERCPYKLLQ